MTGVSLPAQAQTSDAGLDVGEVVVTARKREERLRDIPLAGTALGKEALDEKASVDTAAAIVNASPGARFNDLGTSTLSEISIRSAGTSQNTNADTPTGLYANGVYVQGGLQFSRATSRASTTSTWSARKCCAGRWARCSARGNAVGGAVNLIAARPQFNDYSGRVQLDWGPWIEKKDIQVISNLGVSETLAFRLGVNWIEQTEGNFKNISTGEYFDEQHGVLLRAQARYADGPLDATLTLQKQELQIPTASFRINIAPGTAGFPRRGYLGPHLKYPQNGSQYGRQDVDQIQATVNYDFGWADLATTASYRQKFTRFFGDQDGFDPAELARVRATGNPAPTQSLFNTQNLEDDTNLTYFDAHLVGERVGPWTWLAGVELLRTDTDYETFLELAGTSSTTTTPQATRQKLFYFSKALYGSVGYDITPDLNVTGEVRYTDDHKRYRIFALGGLGPPGQRAAGAVGADQVTQPITLREYDKDNISYNLTLSWKFDPVVDGFREGGHGLPDRRLRSGIDPPPPQVAPNPDPADVRFVGDDDSYELGVKGNPLPNLYTTLSVYRNVTEDVLATAMNGCAPTLPACSARGTSFIINGGEARTWGVEAEGHLRYEWMGGNGSFSLAASRQEGKYHGSSIDGFEVPQSADWIVSANLFYQRPITERWTGFMNWNYRGQWGGVQNVPTPGTALFKLSDFQVVDVRFGVVTPAPGSLRPTSTT